LKLIYSVLLMLVDRLLRLTMRSVKRETLDRILHAVGDLSKEDPYNPLGASFEQIPWVLCRIAIFVIL